MQGALAIFNYLLDVTDYPLERICDSFDLMVRSNTALSLVPGS